MTSRGGVISGFSVLNSNVRHAMSALSEAGLLSEFHTTLDTTRAARILRNTPFGATLSRRSLPQLVHEHTRAHPFSELTRLVKQRTAAKRFFPNATVDASLRSIDSAVARRIGNHTSAVYGYEDSSLRSFTAAADLGIPRIYDLPIAYWRAGERLLDEEADLQPEWAGTLSHRKYSDRKARQDRKDSEIGLSTRIVTASTFTRDSLSEYPGVLPPVEVVPYGAPAVLGSRRRRRPGSLRVLFVGGLSQRKGVSYFFEAVQQMGSAVDVTVVGLKGGESSALDRALAGVSWIPSAPHGQVLELMRGADVLVFPSLFEGFGLVLTEALSQGLPIIATANTAAPDLITDGVEGWIVPIRSASAIRERLEILADDLELAEAMSEAAHARARSLLWAPYEQAIAALLFDVLGRERNSGHERSDLRGETT